MECFLVAVCSKQYDCLQLIAKINLFVIMTQVELGGHSKAVLCLSSAPQGNRVVTGSIDYSAKIFDFGGMDRYEVILQC